MYTRIILSVFIFLLPAISFAAVHCDSENIAEILAKIEESDESEKYNFDKFHKELTPFVSNQVDNYRTMQLDQAKDFFIKKQNEKYKFAFKYMIDNFSDIENESNVLVTSSLDSLAEKDIYVSYYKERLIGDKKRIIPATIMFRS